MKRFLRKLYVTIAIIIAMISLAFAQPNQASTLIYCSPFIALCTDAEAKQSLIGPMEREVFELGCARARFELDNVAFAAPDELDRMPDAIQHRVRLYKMSPADVQAKQSAECMKWFATGVRQ